MSQEYTYVQVTIRQREKETPIVYFLVAADAKHASAEMERLIAERGILHTIDFEKINAATLDPKTIIVRNELTYQARLGGADGKVCAVDGTVIELPPPAR